MRKIAIAFVTAAALSACSGGGTPLSPIVARAPIAASSAPASTSSSRTLATFVIHWPAATQAASSAKRRETISPSTQSISVTVNGTSPTIVNKPTVTGNPSTTSVSIVAPPGNDGFTFTAFDQLNATGNILDQSTVNQNIVANATNTISVALDGICAALVPTLSGSPTFITYQNTSAPLVSGTRTILQSARLIGPSPKTVAFTRVDADGNTILTSAGVAPIAVQEAGTTPHVTIAPVAAGVTNTSFTLTPIAAEPDNVSTTVTATSPDCGTGTPTFPNSFQLSTSAEVVVADAYAGLQAYDQDGASIAQLSTTLYFSGVAYNAKSGYLVAIKSNNGNGIAFQTLSPTGSAIGNGTFTPQTVGNDSSAATQNPGQIAYDPINGNFYLALMTTSKTVSGAVEEYAINGSTATYGAATDLPEFVSDVDPTSIIALSNGNLVVNDESSTDQSNNETFTYLLPSSLNNYISVDQTETTSLASDTTRQNVIGFSPSTTSAQAGGLQFGERLYGFTTFTTPEMQSLNITASAYNPGNDELYFFDITGGFGEAYGLAGTTVYNGGSTESNLSGNAFTGLYYPNAAVVLP